VINMNALETWLESSLMLMVMNACLAALWDYAHVRITGPGQVVALPAVVSTIWYVWLRVQVIICSGTGYLWFSAYGQHLLMQVQCQLNDAVLQFQVCSETCSAHGKKDC
jgi:hypothetical protein